MNKKKKKKKWKQFFKFPKFKNLFLMLYINKKMEI
jgi:hypothetical protein